MPTMEEDVMEVYWKLREKHPERALGIIYQGEELIEYRGCWEKPDEICARMAQAMGEKQIRPLVPRSKMH